MPILNGPKVLELLGEGALERIRQKPEDERQDLYATLRTFLRDDGITPDTARAMVDEFAQLVADEKQCSQAQVQGS